MRSRALGSTLWRFSLSSRARRRAGSCCAVRPGLGDSLALLAVVTTERKRAMKQSKPRVGMGLLAVLALSLSGAVRGESSLKNALEAANQKRQSQQSYL